VRVVDEATRSTEVIVPDYQLSLAIGREGQNARLAARLTGWRIDIKSDAHVSGGTKEETGPAGGGRRSGR
jgi:N utilization substance protein A